MAKDWSIFCEGNRNYASAGKISLGTLRLPLPVIPLLEDSMMKVTNNLYDGDSRTIGIPFGIDFSKSNVLIAEYSNTTEDFLLRGIQNIFLNLIRYEKDFVCELFFADPIRFNSSSLGCLSPLAGEYSVIDEVPDSMEKLRKKIKMTIDYFQQKENLVFKKSDDVHQILVFHDFPNSYDSGMVSLIQQLCANVSYYGIYVILTHNTSVKGNTSSNEFSFLKSRAILIRFKENSFYTDTNLNGNSFPFAWYQSPESLPKNLTEHYIHNRPVFDKSNVYEKRFDFSDMPMYSKGNRKICEIPFSITEDGEVQYLDFEDSNFASFICGASRSGKSTLLHTIISGVLMNTHPDDVEIWLIDFKMTEFSRYIKYLPPHVRYIILDESPELVYDIVDRLTEILTKRQNIFKGKWQKLDEVPKSKYMPSILVIIDEFSVMSQILAESVNAGKDNYVMKMQTLLAKGAALGMHFIFASQGFTSGTRGLNDFSKKQVQQRIAMKTEFAEIKATLDLISTSDEDKALMEQLSVHHTLLRIPVDSRGNHLKLSKVLYISDYSVQEQYIERIKTKMTTVPRYNPEDVSTYINKQPLVVDGNVYLAFAEKRKKMYQELKKNQEDYMNSDEYVLFLGEPRCMKSVCPVKVINQPAENFLMIGSDMEYMALTSVILSSLESLQMQGIKAEFWTTKKNKVYRQIHSERNIDVNSYTNLDDICRCIHEIKDNIEHQIETNRLFILLGFETFINEMSFQPANIQTSVYSQSKPEQFERRRPGELDLLTLLSRNDMKMESEIKDNYEHRKEKFVYDAREDLKYIFTHGPRLGYHFMILFNTVKELSQCKLNISLFRHKILFRIPKMDAVELVNGTNANLVSQLENHAFRYSNGLDDLSFRPYLHEGLSWDGWMLVNGHAENMVEEEEEYLL